MRKTQLHRRRHGHDLVRAAGLALLLLGAGAAGCATPKVDYDKPGVTSVTFQRDLRACRREAYNRYTLAIFQRVDPAVVNRCMERRGYTVKPEG